MSKFIFTLVAFMALIFTSCEKEEIKPSNPKENLRECKNCEGSWDITDPKNDDGEIPGS